MPTSLPNDIVVAESDHRTVFLRPTPTGVFLAEVSAGHSDQLGAGTIVYLTSSQAARLAAGLADFAHFHDEQARR